MLQNISRVARRVHASGFSSTVARAMSTAPSVHDTPAQTYARFLQRLNAKREAALVGGGEARIAKQVCASAC